VYADDFDQYSPYIVKKNETIIGILKSHNIAPLYGEQDWLEKVLDLNRLTYQTAKKIRVGEVLVLPIERKYFAADELDQNYNFEDKVKLTQSKVQVVTDDNLKMISLHKFEIGAFYFARRTKLLGSSVDSFGNYGVTVSYRRNKLLNKNNFFVNAGGSGSAFNQGVTTFSDDRSLSAIFSPSVMAKLFLEIEEKKFHSRFSTFLSTEFLSNVDKKDFDYIVRKDLVLSLGIGLGHSVSIVNNELDYYGRYEVGVFHQETTKATNVEQMSLSRFKLGSGYRFENDIRVGTEFSFAQLMQGEKYMLTGIVNINYRL